MINDNNPAKDSQITSIKIDKQDSIESTTPQGGDSKGYKRQDPGYNQLVKEYVFYNINKQTYQPFYKERLDEHDKRK